jgi:hypothetical protein
MRSGEIIYDGIEFTALLLDPVGKRLPVMHSDDVFLLLFGNPSIEQFRKIIQPFLLSYPFGLSFLEDGIGFAISNPVYAPPDFDSLQDKTKNVWVKFGPDEYHGRGAWPWVMFALVNGIYDMVISGIDAQGALHTGFRQDDLSIFKYILEKMRMSIKKVGSLATSEVYKIAPANMETATWQACPMEISTPIQLWSAAPTGLLVNEALERIRLADHGRSQP